MGAKLPQSLILEGEKKGWKKITQRIFASPYASPEGRRIFEADIGACLDGAGR